MFEVFVWFQQIIVIVRNRIKILTAKPDVSILNLKYVMHDKNFLVTLNFKGFTHEIYIK